MIGTLSAGCGRSPGSLPILTFETSRNRRTSPLAGAGRATATGDAAPAAGFAPSGGPHPPPARVRPIPSQ